METLEILQTFFSVRMVVFGVQICEIELKFLLIVT